MKVKSYLSYLEEVLWKVAMNPFILCILSSPQVVHELELYNTGYYLGMFMNSFAVFQVCFAYYIEKVLMLFTIANPFRISDHFEMLTFC